METLFNEVKEPTEVEVEEPTADFKEIKPETRRLKVKAHYRRRAPPIPIDSQYKILAELGRLDSHQSTTSDRLEAYSTLVGPWNVSLKTKEYIIGESVKRNKYIKY